jgi:tRNA A37 threonylcarbamoyladenosine modification protein TsaB|tara:strand:- start:181 stop:564 length:384 start_codon:yes stop_codon:yes gene_type:complete
MIGNFLIINFTGNNNILGLRIDKKFIVEKIQNNSNTNEILVNKIMDFLKKNEITIDKSFSIIVNQGPGSFSSIRVSLAVAKGIKISTGANLFGFKDIQLRDFNLENIEELINKNLLENKLINPVYLS